ncbi:MAG: DMT family transporter [Helicobacter sp.]|uniref:DMT family transporter n=1 Tax=Helicobacter sp. TaxID=218 RepID=UPI0037520635|nr:DMT family transporter [Helicobacter sp.]
MKRLYVAHYSHISLGIINMFISALFFAMMNACVKILAPAMSAVESIFFRSIIMVVLLLVFFAFKPPKKKTKQGGWWLLFLRSLFGGLSMLALFYNITHISLGVASTFSQTMPIYVVLLSMIFLRERVGFVVLFATLLGFGGIVLICDPHFNSIPVLNIIVGIIGGFMMALAFISLRNLKGYFDDNVVVLVFGITMSVVSLGILVTQAFLEHSWSAVWSNPSPSEWIIVLIMGIFGTFGQYFLTKAYMLAPAGIVAPIDYTRVVFGLIFGIMLGDALPHISVALGMVLVILSGIIIGLPNLLKDLRSIKGERI